MQAGEIYIAQIRNLDYYVAIKITGVNIYANYDFVFDYKYTGNCNTTVGSIEVTSCDNYTSPSGSYIWTTTNTYIDTISNIAGCDSIIIVNLIIDTIDISIMYVGPLTLASNALDATYQWIDCDNDSAYIVGATNQVFTGNGGYYAVEVTKNGCTDTSACFWTGVLGLSENRHNIINVYPNPTVETVSINLDKVYNEIQVNVRDALGKQLDQYPFYNSDILIFDVKGAPGIYFIEILSKKEKTLLKILKK